MYCFVYSERGVVWEETIILLPDNVHYVFLSATIPNARQFAEWICHLHKQVLHDTRHEKTDPKVFVVVGARGRAHPSFGMTPTFREYDL